MLANIIAGLSLAVSLVLGVFYVLDRRHARFALERDHVNDLLRWHASVIEILIRLRSVSAGNEDERAADLARLSAKIEEGRFYFPNIDLHDGFGAEKPSAYQGYRNFALELLVASYDLFAAEDCLENLNQATILQRHFTSIVFEVVRPKERLEQIRTLTDRYFVKDLALEHLFETGDREAIDAIWRARRGQPR